MNRALIYFALAGVAAVLQTVLMPLLLQGDYKPDLVLLLVVYLGLHEGQWRGGLVVYLMGWFFDGVGGVFPGLKDGKLEVVPASAMAAVAFQWYTKLKYMSSGNFNIIVGGSIISKKKFNELSEADQQTLLDTAKRAASKLDQVVGRDDARAYETLLGRGITAVDAAANQAAWDAAAERAREQLVKRGVFSKSLLKAVEAASK